MSNNNELDQRLADEFQFDKHVQETKKLHGIPEQIKFWANKKREFNSIVREYREYDDFGIMLALMRMRYRTYFNRVDDQLAYLKELLPIEKYQSSLGESTNKPVRLYEAPGNSELPNPKEVAELYHIEKGSKHKEYTTEQIAPVMEATKNYIEENPGIHTIYGHIKTVSGRCNGLTGGRVAKSNWIKFYAEKAGLENK